MRAEELDWLESHVRWTERGCLIWPFRRDRFGYAIMSGKGTAHRIMCRLARGDNPPHKPLVRHLCGAGRLGCVNPRHLDWGTIEENNRDQVEHGIMRSRIRRRKRFCMACKTAPITLSSSWCDDCRESLRLPPPRSCMVVP